MGIEFISITNLYKNSMKKLWPKRYLFYKLFLKCFKKKNVAKTFYLGIDNYFKLNCINFKKNFLERIGISLI
jgi:hypothetical protein